MQKLTQNEIEAGVAESLGECYGHEGDIKSLLDRATAQRRFSEALKPETD
jgi:hypothetical protein